ncbi:hypothetical protein BDW42DRAFT_15824 [Aspergillus taichungensis]|uniref:Zn(2)-C6 fungal-type domain-containing protein n=1 Tax=Aspergillus taichungensis TaxID=482145 RepID=A0A2J5HIA8_9EURO|nr:hypothetical protein BDW42DRAFT_15824 [Aspergillus taichungensis]
MAPTSCAIAVAPISAGAAGPPLANGLQPLSCFRCAHRKVRCDRVVPCSNCIRHDAVCDFPQPRTEKRQRRKMAGPPTSRKTHPRVKRYRDVFDTLGSEVESMAESPGPAHSPLHDRTPSPDLVDTDAAGRLIVEGNRSRFIEEDLWMRVGEELNASALFPGEDEDDGTGGLALGLSPETRSTEGLYPSHHHFHQLWSIYLSNVHPITMILHAPSARGILEEAAKGPGHASKDDAALLFATMVGALTSVTDAECARLLGEKRSVLLARYRLGCEVALTNANFLISSNLCVLQAYTIYLVAINPHVDPCKMWNLSGIATRNAQRLGLHQELVSGLTAFETEMRRRLWSQIAILDVTSTQSVGLQTHISHKFPTPSNVNDADIFPSMKEAPKQRIGATDMIFCNLRHKVMKFMGQVNSGKRPWAASGKQWTPAVNQLYRTERERAVAELEDELELELLRYCDMLNPVHFFTVIVARLTLCKLRYSTWKPRLGGKSESDCSEKDRDGRFTAALKVLEYENNANSQPSIQRFLWHAHQHFSWSSLVQILGDLMTRPCGEHAEQAWEQVRLLYSCRPSLYQTAKSKFPIHRGINKMVVDAWRVKETAASDCGRTLTVPAYITVLREHEQRVESMGQNPQVSGQSASKEPREHGLKPRHLSNTSVQQTSVNWPAWPGLTVGTSDPSNDNGFLDATLDQEISMSVESHNCGVYSSDILMPPLNQYVSGGGGW